MLKFKENLSSTHKMGVIIPIILCIIPFLILSLTNFSNLIFILIFSGWCIFSILVVIYRLNSLSTIVLSDKMLLVPNRYYYKHSGDINKQVKILQGKLLIPYKEIIEITIRNKTIYLTYIGLSSSIIIQPRNIEQFILALKEKFQTINLNIPIHNESDKNLLYFKNDILTNKPTLLGFAIIFLLPNLVGIFNLITANGIGTFIEFDSLIFAIITALVTIIFFISIFKYRTIIILSDKEIIETSQLDNDKYSSKKIAYTDIKKITKTKWRVNIKTRTNDEIYFVSNPETVNIFYAQIKKKANK